jgi:hypothetical protein
LIATGNSFEKWLYSKNSSYEPLLNSGIDGARFFDTYNEALAEMSGHIKDGIAGFQDDHYRIVKVMYGGWVISYAQTNNSMTFYVQKDHGEIIPFYPPQKGNTLLYFDNYGAATEYASKLKFDDKLLGFIKIHYMANHYRLTGE